MLRQGFDLIRRLDRNADEHFAKIALDMLRPDNPENMHSLYRVNFTLWFETALIRYANQYLGRGFPEKEAGRWPLGMEPYSLAWRDYVRVVPFARIQYIWTGETPKPAASTLTDARRRAR